MSETGVPGVAVLCVLASVLLSGCQAESPTYPFRGSWVALGADDVGLVLEPDGTAEARGELPAGMSCPDGMQLWRAGEGHWASDTDGRVLLYLSADPRRALAVEAKQPFGEPSWTTVFVGVCGESSSTDQYLEMHGKTADSGD